jgi:hypothetical protein
MIMISSQSSKIDVLDRCRLAHVSPRLASVSVTSRKCRVQFDFDQRTSSDSRMKKANYFRLVKYHEKGTEIAPLK